MPEETLADRIADDVAELVGRIGETLDAGSDVDVLIEGQRITATLEGDAVAPFIGRHGQVIEAVQHLATRVAARHAPGGSWVVTVDAGDYRARRAAILDRIADEAATEAVERERSVALDPMTASERRYVHELLREREGIETHSEGAEPNRHLVVAPARPQ